MARLVEAKHEASRLLENGDAASAMAVCVAILKAAPLDFEVRMQIADCLVSIGDKPRAAEVYRATAHYCLSSGHPLVALVCARVIEEGLGLDSSDVVVALVARYGSESELVGKFAARVRVPDPGLEITGQVQPVDAIAAASVAVHCTDNFDGFPKIVHPIPLLSELSEGALRRVVSTLVVRRVPPKTIVIREGEPGQSFFFVASGELVVVDTDATGKHTELARLHENTIVGEMALVSAQPRSASVIAVTSADLIEVTRESLSALAGELPQVAEALHKFTMDRLIGNVMATSPLFKPFSSAQRHELLRRFTSHDVAVGTPIIHQGEEGQGLFLVLAGEVEVTATGEDGLETQLAVLRPGEVFGEVSLLRECPTTATVTAGRPSTVLFLARDYVNRIVEGIPALREYLEALAEGREAELAAPLLIAADDELQEDEIVILF